MPVILAAGLFTAGTAVLAAANTAAGGPDYVGIAAVIAACASAFGTVVAGVITILRFARSQDPITPDDIGEAVERALRKKAAK